MKQINTVINLRYLLKPHYTHGIWKRLYYYKRIVYVYALIASNNNNIKSRFFRLHNNLLWVVFPCSLFCEAHLVEHKSQPLVKTIMWNVLQFPKGVFSYIPSNDNVYFHFQKSMYSKCLVYISKSLTSILTATKSQPIININGKKTDDGKNKNRTAAAKSAFAATTKTVPA